MGDFLFIYFKEEMKNIAIFGSGAGTNAEKIIEYFSHHPTIKVALVVSNKHEAGILKVALNNDIPSVVVNRGDFYSTDKLIILMKEKEIDLIVLAGFLWMIPENILKNYPDKLLNIHPALLPEFGGKGMYGMKVHEQVHQSGKLKTGISIHKVNEHYDEGEIVFQTTCDIDSSDTPASIATKVQQLEHHYYPIIIERVMSDEL